MKFIDVYSGNVGSLHNYECLACFYEFPKRPNDVDQGGGCPRCAGSLPKTQEECESEALERNLKFKSVYSGRSADLHDYECLACFYEFPMRPNNVQQKQGCPKCGIARRTLYKTKAEKKLSRALRQRFRYALKDFLKTKKVSAVKDLGCTVEEAVNYLESKFHTNPETGEEMGWHNYGDWHIDHIKPLARCNLDTVDGQREAVHYTNLQPLWWKDNLSKGAKYNPP